MNLWTTTQAAEHLGILKARTAKRKLLEFGVRPISMGRGRGMGDRWRPQEIEAALDKLQGQQGMKAAPRHGKLGLIIGRDISELIRDLTSSSPKQ
jgi:hypothetical protein